jgi:hypothetical protein
MTATIIHLAEYRTRPAAAAGAGASFPFWCQPVSVPDLSAGIEQATAIAQAYWMAWGNLFFAPLGLRLETSQPPVRLTARR